MNHLLNELKQYKQWVCHNSDKVPLIPGTIYPASPTNPNHWRSYEEALAAVGSNGAVGVGFVLTKADPFVCIDLDPTQDANNLVLHSQIFDSFNSYVEKSPSGKGAHIWVRGSIPANIKRTDKKFEMYVSEHYITYTGHALEDRNLPVADCSETLASLWASFQTRGNAAPTQIDNNSPDNDVCKQAANASNGELFKALYMGYWQGKYPSQSEADQALCNIIAYYTDSQEQVVRIFRASVLGQRDKAKRDDYVGRMARKAFDQKLPLTFDPATLTFGSQPQIQNVPLPFDDGDEDIEFAQPGNIRTEWNWILPQGKLGLLAGPPGVGKSTIAFGIASTFSSGGVWPDGTQAKQGRVIIWSSEDDANERIFPCLDAMGANTDNIHIIKAKRNKKNEKLPFNPAKDIKLLKKVIRKLGGVSLVVIDPITDAIAGDMHKGNEVRRDLQGAVDLASEFNCIVLGITHFAKGTQGRNPAERVIGSVAFGAFARIVLVAAKDEETGRCVLVIAKNNLSSEKGGFYYSIQSRWTSDGVPTSVVDWGGAIEGNAREILAQIEHQDTKESDNRTKLEDAQTFLIEELKNGPRYVAHLIRYANEQLGISEATLTRAKAKLGISHIRDTAGYLWTLPLSPDNPIQYK